MELTVLDPRSGDTVSQVPIADASTCDDAIARARAASVAWAHTSAAERAAAVTAAAAAVRAGAEELAELNEQETGKLKEDALGGVEAGAATRCSTPSWARCTAAAACAAPGPQRI